MKSFGEFVFSILVSLLSGVVRSWAACTLWLWFVVPQFHMAPLSWKVAYGLILLAELLQGSPPEYTDNSYGTLICRSIAFGVAVPVIAVFIGWIILKF